MPICALSHQTRLCSWSAVRTDRNSAFNCVPMSPADRTSSPLQKTSRRNDPTRRVSPQVQVAKDRSGTVEALRVLRTTRKTAIKCRRAALQQLLAGHVTLQAAHDLAFGQPLQGPASDIGSGPLVGSHSAHDDHVEGGVGLAVASAVRRWRCVFPLDAGIGQTPHIMAKLASDARSCAA